MDDEPPDGGELSPPAILVTVREVRGSAPREPGVWMLVTDDGIEGTIGGGNLEWRAMQAARAMLASGERLGELALPLGPTLTQCCGGHVVLELRRVDGAELARLRAAEPRGSYPLIALFGAGHVGRAVVAALAPLPCRVVWLDPRAELLAGPVPANVTPIPTAEVVRHVEHLPEATFVLVMTHSHPLDLEIVAAVLQRPELPWVGLIGSLTKRRRFESQFTARGLSREAVARLVCPIGIAGITGKAPPVIAASVAAQLLMAFEARAASVALRGAA